MSFRTRSFLALSLLAVSALSLSAAHAMYTRTPGGPEETAGGPSRRTVTPVRRPVSPPLIQVAPLAPVLPGQPDPNAYDPFASHTISTQPTPGAGAGQAREPNRVPTYVMDEIFRIRDAARANPHNLVVVEVLTPPPAMELNFPPLPEDYIDPEVEIVRPAHLLGHDFYHPEPYILRNDTRVYVIPYTFSDNRINVLLGEDATSAGRWFAPTAKGQDAPRVCGQDRDGTTVSRLALDILRTQTGIDFLNGQPTGAHDAFWNVPRLIRTRPGYEGVPMEFRPHEVVFAIDVTPYLGPATPLTPTPTFRDFTRVPLDKVLRLADPKNTRNPEKPALFLGKMVNGTRTGTPSNSLLTPAIQMPRVAEMLRLLQDAHRNTNVGGSGSTSGAPQPVVSTPTPAPMPQPVISTPAPAPVLQRAPVASIPSGPPVPGDWQVVGSMPAPLPAVDFMNTPLMQQHVTPAAPVVTQPTHPARLLADDVFYPTIPSKLTANTRLYVVPYTYWDGCMNILLGEDARQAGRWFVPTAKGTDAKTIHGQEVGKTTITALAVDILRTQTGIDLLNGGTTGSFKALEHTPRVVAVRPSNAAAGSSALPDHNVVFAVDVSRYLSPTQQPHSTNTFRGFSRVARFDLFQPMVTLGNPIEGVGTGTASNALLVPLLQMTDVSAMLRALEDAHRWAEARNGGSTSGTSRP